MFYLYEHVIFLEINNVLKDFSYFSCFIPFLYQLTQIISSTLYAKLLSMFHVLCSSKQIFQNLPVTCPVAFRVLSKKTELPFVLNTNIMLNLAPHLVFIYNFLLIMW